MTSPCPKTNRDLLHGAQLGEEDNQWAQLAGASRVESLVLRWNRSLSQREICSKPMLHRQKWNCLSQVPIAAGRASPSISSQLRKWHRRKHRNFLFRRISGSPEGRLPTPDPSPKYRRTKQQLLNSPKMRRIQHQQSLASRTTWRRAIQRWSCSCKCKRLIAKHQWIWRFWMISITFLNRYPR